MRFLLAWLPLLIAVALPAPARAQPPSMTEVTRAAPAEQARDSHLGGGILLPTAETQPAGTTIVGNYELAVMGVSYSPTDDLQLSLTALAPITTDIPLIALPSVKLRLLGRERFHVAVIGSASYVRDQGVGAAAVAGGVVGSLCLDDDCNSLLSASVGLAHLFVEDEENPDGMDLTVGGVSWVQRVAPRVKLLVEVGRATLDPESLGYAGYGIRLYSERLAADLTFLVDAEGDAAELFPLGVPFAALSWRL